MATQSSAGYAAQAQRSGGAGRRQPPAGGGRGTAAIGDVEAAFQTRSQGRRGGVRLPAAVARAARAAELHGALHHDGKLEIWSPSQIPCAAASGARRRHRAGERHDAPRAGRRRIRPSAGERLRRRSRPHRPRRHRGAGRGGAAERAGQAAVDPRRRHGPRPVPAGRLPLLQGRARRRRAS